MRPPRFFVLGLALVPIALVAMWLAAKPTGDVGAHHGPKQAARYER